MELNRNGGKKDEHMDKEIYKDLIKEALKHECRLSDRQIRLLEWQHISECSVRTRTGREAKISKTTYAALQSLPHESKKYVFYRPTEPVYKPNWVERMQAKRINRVVALINR